MRQHASPEPTGAPAAEAARPKVSVLMAAYNAERWLAAAVDSILEQDFRDFEFIVIDDASTDGTAAILARRAAADERIVLLRNPENLGLTRSLNIGLRAARGTYIARMDADDIALPARLGRQVAFLDAHPDYVLLGTAVLGIDAAGRVRHADCRTVEAWEFAWFSVFRPPLLHPTAMFRASLAREHGVHYDESRRTAQDFEYWPRMLQYGHGHVLGEPLLHYRTHEGNVSSSKAMQQAQDSRAVAGRHLARLYPAGAPAGIDVLLDLLFYQAAASPETLAAAVAGMDRFAADFLAGRDLSRAQRRRLRVLAIRWLTMAALRGGARPGSALFFRFLWLVRGYWPALAREALGYLGRRARRLSPAGRRPAAAAS